MYFTVRSKLEDIFGEVNPQLPNMKEFRDIACVPKKKLKVTTINYFFSYMVIHPKTFNNNRIYFFKMRQENMGEKLEPINVLRQLLNIAELRLKEDVTWGDHFIIDGRYVPISYVFKITPTLVYKSVEIIYEVKFN